MAETPDQPNAQVREHLLAVLADLVAQGGRAPLLAPPLELGREAFPDSWRPTLGGARQLLERLAWHAGLDRAIDVTDSRMGAPPTERRPATQLDTHEVRRKTAAFTLGFLGNDDIPGMFAHEIGVAYAALHRPTGSEPYREPAEIGDVQIDADRDLERGSIATVYLGLGVLAANAAYQQYSVAGRFNGGFDPLEYDVLTAGYVPMSALAFLLAVQAIVRDKPSPPPGLSPPQRDEVLAWLGALRGQGAELRGRLGLDRAAPSGDETPTIAPNLAWRTSSPRSALAPLAEPDDADDEVVDPTPRSIAFRWRSHRGGVGFLAGAVLGVGVATLVAFPPSGPAARARARGRRPHRRPQGPRPALYDMRERGAPGRSGVPELRGRVAWRHRQARRSARSGRTPRRRCLEARARPTGESRLELISTCVVAHTRCDVGSSRHRRHKSLFLVRKMRSRLRICQCFS